MEDFEDEIKTTKKNRAKKMPPLDDIYKPREYVKFVPYASPNMQSKVALKQKKG